MTNRSSPMIMEEVEDPIASNFSALAICLFAPDCGERVCPECLILPKVESVNVSLLIGNGIFPNLSSSGELYRWAGFEGVPI